MGQRNAHDVVSLIAPAVADCGTVFPDQGIVGGDVARLTDLDGRHCLILPSTNVAASGSVSIIGAAPAFAAPAPVTRAPGWKFGSAGIASVAANLTTGYDGDVLEGRFTLPVLREQGASRILASLSLSFKGARQSPPLTVPIDFVDHGNDGPFTYQRALGGEVTSGWSNNIPLWS